VRGIKNQWANNKNELGGLKMMKKTISIGIVGLFVMGGLIGIFLLTSYDVNAAGNPPVITTTDVINATEDHNYSVDYEANDPDVGEVLTYLACTLPTGLGYTSAVWDGQYAYIFGGWRQEDIYSNETHRFDPITENILTFNSKLPSARGYTSAVWNGQYAYVFGGKNGSSYFDDIIRFNPIGDEISLLSSTLPSGRYGTSAVWDGQYAYIFGGYDGSSFLDDIVRFDPITGNVSKINTSLPTVRANASAVWDGQYAYIFGGSSDLSNLAEIVQFDPSSESVNLLNATLPRGEEHTSAVWEGQYEYIFGGHGSYIFRFNSSFMDVTTLDTTISASSLGISSIWTGQYVYMFGGEFRTTNPMNCYGVGQIAQFEPGEVLTWSLATNSTWLSIEPFTGVLSGTPTHSDVGYFWVNVTVDDGNSGTDWHNFTLTVWGRPNITIEKTSDLTTAEPGDIINYTIYYNNTGSGEAGTVWINDTMSNGVTFVTSSAEANRTGDCNWIFYNVGVDEHNFTISVQVNGGVPNGTILTNYVHLEYIDSSGNPMLDSWDFVNVTILNGASENQPPTILNCPDLMVHPDSPYTFNYTPYIHDVDTPLSELILTCDDPAHTSINGLQVTYLYPDAMAGQVVLVNLTISDGEGSDSAHLYVIIASEVIDSGIEIYSLTLSKFGPTTGEEVTIYIEILNVGTNSCDIIVRFYDGDPNTEGIQIDDDQTVTIPSSSTHTVSVNWMPSSGDHTIYAIVENLATGEKAMAYLQVTVGENIPPILVLSTGDINIYRFESGQERTISVEVTCYLQTVNNVHLVILDDQNLTIDHTITPLRTMTDGETTKFYLRIKAPELPEGVEKLEKDIVIQVVGDGVFSNAEELDIVVSQSAVTFLNPITIAGVVATGSIATLGAAAAASRRNENWKYLLLLTFAVPLYTRIHGKKTLDNFVRGQVFGHIQSQPGTHFNEIKKTLKLGNGNLAYHLRKLEKEGFIISKRDKRFRRFYPVGVGVPEEDGIKLSKNQENILDFIERHPKSNQKEIAKELKESQQTISYNINVLVREGFLKEEKIEGTKTYEIFDENT